MLRLCALLWVVVAAGCVDRAYAQSAPASDAGTQRRVPRYRITAPRGDADADRARLVREAQRSPTRLLLVLGGSSDGGRVLSDSFAREPTGDVLGAVPPEGPGFGRMHEPIARGNLASPDGGTIVRADAGALAQPDAAPSARGDRVRRVTPSR
ncbi:MAG: hypothetical protein JNK05_12880 [Myxococcales bacterium]|nr:hypothetical protein [Myxococcales bacterium]